MNFVEKQKSSAITLNKSNGCIKNNFNDFNDDSH